MANDAYYDEDDLYYEDDDLYDEYMEFDGDGGRGVMTKPKKRKKPKAAAVDETDSTNDNTATTTTAGGGSGSGEGDGEKVRLTHTDDILKRLRHGLKWNEVMRTHEWTVGYEDRFDGIKEVDFKVWEEGIDSDLGKIPQHRIRYFKMDGEVVWDKASRLDVIFQDMEQDSSTAN